jgi:hypothetical protein
LPTLLKTTTASVLGRFSWAFGSVKLKKKNLFFIKNNQDVEKEYIISGELKNKLNHAIKKNICFQKVEKK